MIRKRVSFVFGFAISVLISCTKNDIQFGNSLGESYTRLIEVDSVGINMSTFISDSFATNNISEFLVGRYNDTLLGKISAKPFVQLSPPADISLEADAVYDSLSFVIKLNKYYYGDTSASQTILISELAQPIEYTYGSSLFSTSSIAENSQPLGSKTMKIKPMSGDSIVVKLSDSKGMELFNKMKGSSSDLQSNDAFLNYFNGVSISFSSNDVSAVYGFRHTTDSIFMRLHYHTTIPYFQEKTKDFSFYSNIYFNQILSDRSSGKLPAITNGQVSSEVLNNQAYTQASAGVLLKMTFPTLRNILQIDPTVKLLKATLQLRVPNNSYDGKLKLPPYLTFAQTDATNTIQSFLADASGTYLYSEPVVDNIYSATTYYSIDLTSYINSLLTNSGREEYGLFLLENTPGASGSMNRAIINNSKNNLAPSKLTLSLLTLKD